MPAQSHSLCLADMLDHVMVESYGTRTPLNRVGTVSVLSPQMLSITPFDQSVSFRATSGATSGQSWFRYFKISWLELHKAPFTCLWTI